MPYPWQEIDTLMSSIDRQINQLENFRDTLYSADILTLRQIYAEDFCAACRGLCFFKANKLNHLRILSKRIEAVSVSLIDLVNTKLYFETLYLRPHCPVIPNPPLNSVDSSEQQPENVIDP